jgi:uncharacterized lipoprotein YmbA
MQKFQLFTPSPLRMRACGTGKNIAEYYQHDEHAQVSFSKTSK